MQSYFGPITIVLLLGMVLSRVLIMKRRGIRAMNFGRADKGDYLILPFALFYFYTIFATAFHLPTLGQQELIRSSIVSWVGVFLCVIGLFLVLLSLVSFGRSFRIGIDEEHPDRLVTTGIFAYTRNPIYVGFGFVLLGEFLVLSNWILLLYMIAGMWLFQRQVLLEEAYMSTRYGQPYLEYCEKVRRYL